MALTPGEAVDQSGTGEGVIGWKLDREERRVLLERFPPNYAETVADHVTLKSKVADDAPLPDATTGRIVGRTDDGCGVQAMVVEIDGTTDRPGGGTYHITWSLGPGRRANESNDVLADRGWTPLDEPVPLTLTPARLR